METKEQIEIDVNLEEFTDEVAALIPDLVEKKDYQKKINARNDLVQMGKIILPQIYLLLNSNNIALKREATKIIQLISDTESIPILIDLLCDKENTIRWIAARGLIRIGRESILPLLESIIKNRNSLYLKLGAHHVFNSLFTNGEKIEFKNLLLSLKNYNNVAIAAPVEAFKALKMFVKDKNTESRLNLLDFVDAYNREGYE